MLLLRCFCRLGRLCIPVLPVAFVLGSAAPVRATEDSSLSTLTVVRRPVAMEVPTTPTLAPGTLSVVPVTTGSEEVVALDEEELLEEQETETVPYASLPESVRAAAERELGGKGDYRAARSEDQGVILYQVSAIKDGLGVELILTEEGQISFITREIPFSRLPLAVQASLRQKNPGGKFTSIQMVTAHAYTATMRGERGEEIELRVEPSGLIESEEPTTSAPETEE